VPRNYWFYGFIGGYALITFVVYPSPLFMDNRSWNILCWTVRCVNDKDKWEPIRNKIDESNANIFCLQETKRESFDLHFIRNFAPKRFENFDFYPSVGTSGGILVCWASNFFSLVTLENISLPLNCKPSQLIIWSPGIWWLFMVPADRLLETLLWIGYTI
jgi:hypothetical protein